ncbi:saccharopine dehydrogenase family protein [Piscinibacter sp.]|uniref:saccharopine dehydrogenase family protein n=1 Tax=Piscinibacter sp. TaxID=1903157 RepID=UPI002C931525|nr:saccharopine dehydrogenase NADP-binding domain-containing protein [Albitalea sp.]HUG23157.1 saccharopine dehydrogenase NADP-binding domain-containing protein [Albitalea sp.]
MADRPFDVTVFGATGYTGRQAMIAMVHRAANEPLRWAVAGRNADKLRSLVAELVPHAAEPPGVIVADAHELESLQRLASQTKVLLNLAGPYALTGEPVVQACIAHGTHHLDLSGETFWVQQLVSRHHRAAKAAQVKVIASCGYEALPFDLATLWVAHQLRERTGEACRQVKIVVSFSGRRIRSIRDAVSGGTVGSLKSLLEYDTTDCVRNPACLLPADSLTASEVAQRNAYRFTPHYDEDVRAVTAPTIPAPFVNPPIVLRSQALIADLDLFTADFRYTEAMNMKSLVPSVAFLPEGSTLPLQWAAAAALGAPLANLSAALAGPLKFERQPLRKLVDWFAPKSGEGPSEEVLAQTGYGFDIFALSASGKKLQARMDAQGHPGYRSTPEMAVTAAVGLARGTLGRTPHFGIVTPATGLGIEAVGAMREAGLVFSVVG